jgi:hypothetical protein
MASYAEVKALQKQLGLSYKDAAHRLYMAELESIRKSHSAAQYLDHLQGRVDAIMIEDVLPAILAIDQGKFDNVSWRNGGREAEEAEP